MKTLRALFSFLAVSVAAAVFAADPIGTWTWATHAPTGDIPTTLTLESKDGKLAGAYANQFGATAISNISLQEDVITFEVVRDFGGAKYVVKYQGKIEGDMMQGTIEAPGHDGGKAVTLDWNAKRAAKKD